MEQLGLFLAAQVPWQRQPYMSPLFSGFLLHILQGAYSEKCIVEEGREKRPSAASTVRLLKTGAGKV